MELRSLGGGVGYLKAAFLGWQGSGKTWTAVELALGTRAYFGLKGPIAMLDTEGGAQYVSAKANAETGQDIIGVQTRTLSDAVEFISECAKGDVSVALIDSASHLWIEWLDSYLKQVNAARKSSGKPERKIEFQDWGVIKRKWAELTDAYLNSRLHVIVCGRAGDLYANEVNDDSGRREIVKTGIKMVAEGQFGYEPSLLVEMELLQNKHGTDARTVNRRAIVLKDRFDVLDGKIEINPTRKFFEPYLQKLSRGAHVSVETKGMTSAGEIDEDGNAEWSAEKRNRQIFSEEIQGALIRFRPGRSDQDKLDKQEILQEALGTRSWTAVENMQSAALKAGLSEVKRLVKQKQDSIEHSRKEIEEKFGVAARKGAV